MSNTNSTYSLTLHLLYCKIYYSMNGQRERIKPGFKLVLAGPDVALLDQEPLDHIERPWPWHTEHEFNEASLREYFAIYNVLKNVVQAKDLVVIKGLHEAYIQNHIQTGSMPETADIPLLDAYYQNWPRDTLTLVGEKVLPRHGVWKGDNGWWLGEGGAVLSRNRTLLVAESLFIESGAEIKWLLQRGIRVAKLPHVQSFTRTSYYKHHIDGHAALIESKDHSLVLLTAESYFLQGRGRDRKRIEKTVKKLEIDLQVVNDKNLPPLAFNLVQLDDGAVVMTGGADELESAISQVVGREKVFATDRPIELIPTYGGGGIRCMTNIFPQYLIG